MGKKTERKSARIKNNAPVFSKMSLSHRSPMLSLRNVHYAKSAILRLGALVQSVQTISPTEMVDGAEAAPELLNSLICTVLRRPNLRDSVGNVDRKESVAI